MQVELLGTGGFFPNDRRHTACMLLPEYGIVFDAGSAAYRLAQRCPGAVLNIFLSHAHLDHISGLTSLLAPMLSGRFTDVCVRADPNVLDAIETSLFDTRVFPVPPQFRVEALPAEGVWELSSQLRVQWKPLPSHPGGSRAYRVDALRPDGRPLRLAYVTDTIVDGSYDDFIEEVDLLIHECYFPDSKAAMADLTGHSYATAVAELALRSKVQSLVLVHVDPLSAAPDPIGLPGIQRIFPAAEIASDGWTTTL